MKLQTYNQKRDFNKTSEPKGKIKTTKTKKQIFVIQYHKAKQNHYDFRLESNGVLISFAVPKGLPQTTNSKRLAIMVEDHPLSYANFEGIIPKGNYGAGTVEIFDKGYFISHQNFEESLKNGNIKITLWGNNIKGAYHLVKTDKNNWLIFKSKDQFAKQSETKTPLSKNPFKKCDVKLCLLTNKIPTGKNWIFEIKYDGYRIISFIENGKAKLFSRNGNSYTLKFTKVAKSLSQMAKNIPMVLDGEIVCFDENGRSDFSLLQKNLKNNNTPFVYVIFDILAHNGKDLKNTPLKERKNILHQILINCPTNLMECSYVKQKGKECFIIAKKLNLEGIVAKDLTSKYNSSRDLSWQKIKCYKQQEFVIGGYEKSNKNPDLSAILVGYYKQNNLIYAGKVGIGFSENYKKELLKKFKPLTQANSSFINKTKNTNNTTWLLPELVAEVKFIEFTNDNLLRQPSFVSLRNDKNPKDIIMEKENENA